MSPAGNAASKALLIDVERSARARGARGGRAMLIAALLALAALAAPALAVEPDEILADPRLEARARALSAELRCLVCQNQSIDDSNAPLAKDLRLLVREQIKGGASDAEVRQYVVARYTEFVLLKPPFNWRTLLLWLAPALVFLAGAALLVRFWQRTSAAPAPAIAALTAEERRRLDALIAESSKSD